MPQVPTTLEAGLPADSIYPFYGGLFMHAKRHAPLSKSCTREATKAMQGL